MKEIYKAPVAMVVMLEKADILTASEETSEDDEWSEPY